MLAIGGDYFLGGQDFDIAIMEYLMEKFLVKTGQDEEFEFNDR